MSTPNADHAPAQESPDPHKPGHPHGQGQVRPHPQPARVWRVRTVLGMLICAAGAVVLLYRIVDGFLHNPNLWHALLAGCVAAAATALGTLPVLLSRQPSDRMRDLMFGFGAGVMLAASAFSLILPGLQAAKAGGLLGGTGWGAGVVMGAAMLLGGVFLLWLERVLPHEHFIKGPDGAASLLLGRRLHRTWLFVAALALHNLPEGLAIGVGVASGTGPRSDALTLGIAIQDVPEGLVVAAALLAAGYSRAFAVTLGAATGLVEPLGAVIGAAAVGQSAILLPWGLGFAAGAMLFVISHELIPESHREGHEMQATAGLMLGFVLMVMLDAALG